MNRLPSQVGEWIDRSKPIEFEFEQTHCTGFAGDTISSALLASGIRTVGRSFKYHRKRGPLSMANHDVNAMMAVAGSVDFGPNVRADVTPLVSGMRVSAVNTIGGVQRDRRAFLDRLSGFLPVGFYYKAFHTRSLFPLWERMFRRFTGLGEVSPAAKRRFTPKRYAFADVAVVGAGPSGLAAALAAATAGAEVVIIDENAELGGSGTYTLREDAASRSSIEGLRAEVLAHPRIHCLVSTTAVGYYADHWIALEDAQRLTKLRARAVVCAQGAFETPAVFRGNDIPGVILRSGAQRLIHRYSVRPANRIAVLTANADGYRAALEAAVRGIEVVAVLDLRSSCGTESAPIQEALKARGVQILQGAAIREAYPGANGELRCIEWSSWSDGRWGDGGLGRIEIDGLWTSVGFTPANSLLHQAGGRFVYDQQLAQFVPRELPAGIFACGKLNGAFGLTARITDGERAGLAAAASLGYSSTLSPRPLIPEPESPSHPYPVMEHPKGKDFVDFDEDLQVKDIVNAAAEGFDSSELLKRYSTMGMGPSQGKHSNMNALRILARISGQPAGELGTTTARPFFHPVRMSSLAGRGFNPERRTPMDADHESLGAVWMSAGIWRRPEYYRRSLESRQQCVAGEAQAVRHRVGLIDVSTLGKIEVHGRGAAEFLNRVYSGRFDTLSPGMTRYGLMLDESGVIIDDGVIARLSDELFYFSTTTGNSATIFRELGRLAVMWGSDVSLVNLTGHYAAINLAGPNAREVLAKLTGLNLDPASFPYLAVREGTVADAPARLLRVGFVGELGYEIHVPAGHGVRLWRALLDAGRDYEIRPFGIEAQRLLRLEKGHIIVGQDTDGLTNPLEIGAGWALGKNKPYYVGGRSIQILRQMPRRQQLVGFSLAEAAGGQVREGHLIIDDGHIVGRVTSIAHSMTLGRWIGLALATPQVAAGDALLLRISDGRLLKVAITTLPFYDPTGARQAGKPEPVQP